MAHTPCIEVGQDGQETSSPLTRLDIVIAVGSILAAAALFANVPDWSGHLLALERIAREPDRLPQMILAWRDDAFVHLDAAARAVCIAAGGFLGWVTNGAHLALIQ